MADPVNLNAYSTSLQAQLKMARDALMAQQTSMNVLSHNVSNVNTEGYHRQRAILQANPQSGTQVGGGVSVQTVDRAYNEFITRQQRTENANVGRWEAQRDGLTQVEDVLNEISDYGIGDALSQFWNAWQDLANDVDSYTSRVNLVSKGQNLGQAMGDAYNNLDNLRKELNISMQASGNQINSLATRIAELNEKIYTAASRRQQPNDLLDQRDELLKQLSKLANITTQNEENGSVTVYLGNDTLVFRNEARQLQWKNDDSGETGKSGGDLVWADTGNAVQIRSGEIYGQLQTRDSIKTLMDGLDELADTLRTNVNALHVQGIARDGSTNNDFFQTGVSGARSLTVDSDVVQDPNRIAASTTSATGDNSLANQIYNLQFEENFQSGQANYSDYYQALVNNIGNKIQNAQTKADAADSALQMTENWQQQYTGVNLDEEMANMVTVQYAFNAATKVSNTVNEMLDTIINKIG